MRNFLFKVIKDAKMGFTNEKGNVDIIKMAILGFVAILVVFQLIPELVDANVIVQADTDASAITKLAGNLGEWLLPVGAVVAIGIAFFAKTKS